MTSDIMRRFRAKGRRPKGTMTKTEEAHAWTLEGMKIAGEIVKYRFERHTLLLGADTRYTPDFEVFRADGFIEFHEVKGARMEDDAWAKLKIAATEFPEYEFVLYQLLKTGWKRTPIKAVTE